MNTLIKISDRIKEENQRHYDLLIGFITHKLSLMERLIHSFSRFIHSDSKVKGLKFYTEFPSGIISPVFKQLKANSYKVVEGIADKRKAKKMRSQNLIIFVYDDYC